MKHAFAACQTRSRVHAIHLFSLLIAMAILFTFYGTIHAAQVSLEWEPGQNAASISGYKVYYGSSSGSYEYTLNIGNYTSCDISGLTEGNRYYFTATSYDASGNESEKSEEISYVAGNKNTDKEKKKRIAAVMLAINELLLKEN